MIALLKHTREWYRLIIWILPLPAALLTGVIHFQKFVLYGGFENGLYMQLYLYTAIMWPLLARYYGLVSVEQFSRETSGIVRPLQAVIMTFLGQSAIMTLIKLPLLSRAYFVESTVCLLVLVVITREVMRTIVLGRLALRHNVSVLIVGTDAYASRVSRKLKRAPISSFEAVGFVRLPGQEVHVNGRSIYEFDQLSSIPHKFDEVVVAVSPERFGQVSEVLESLQEFSKPIHAVFDFGNRAQVQERLFTFGTLQVVDLRFAPTESFGYLVVKRVFDVTFSAIGLLLASPLMLMIAVLIRLSSRGTILFRQERVGLNGQVFEMLKFRTMRVADTSQSNTLWTQENDPRRTKVGGFLRKTSLDELPQLWNVLKGDMSLVGPRPERPYFVSKFRHEIDKYNIRHNVKVGITGWAQVNGLRGDTSIKRRIKYDLYYVQNWSLLFDIRIIVRTFRALWKAQNAY